MTHSREELDGYETQFPFQTSVRLIARTEGSGIRRTHGVCAALARASAWERFVGI